MPIIPQQSIQGNAQYVLRHQNFSQLDPANQEGWRRLAAGDMTPLASGQLSAMGDEASAHGMFPENFFQDLLLGSILPGGILGAGALGGLGAGGGGAAGGGAGAIGPPAAADEIGRAHV